MNLEDSMHSDVAQSHRDNSRAIPLTGGIESSQIHGDRKWHGDHQELGWGGGEKLVLNGDRVSVPSPSGMGGGAGCPPA